MRLSKHLLVRLPCPLFHPQSSKKLLFLSQQNVEIVGDKFDVKCKIWRFLFLLPLKVN